MELEPDPLVSAPVEHESGWVEDGAETAPALQPMSFDELSTEPIERREVAATVEVPLPSRAEIDDFLL